jgi:hypothetical protein
VTSREVPATTFSEVAGYRYAVPYLVGSYRQPVVP